MLDGVVEGFHVVALQCEERLGGVDVNLQGKEEGFEARARAGGPRHTDAGEHEEILQEAGAGRKPSQGASRGKEGRSCHQRARGGALPGVPSSLCPGCQSRCSLALRDRHRDTLSPPGSPGCQGAQ